MTQRFIIDAQLPPALADHLNAKGMEAEHVNRIGLGAASDAAIWQRAIASRAVLITKDRDFAELATHLPNGTQVVWIRLGNVTNEVLWRSLEPLLPEILAALSAGERMIEIA